MVGRNLLCKEEVREAGRRGEGARSGDGGPTLPSSPLPVAKTL